MRQASENEKRDLFERQNSYITDYYHFRQLLEDERTVEVIYTNTSPMIFARFTQVSLTSKHLYVYRYYRVWTDQIAEVPVECRQGTDWGKEGF
jgi:hypothetical protein